MPRRCPYNSRCRAHHPDKWSHLLFAVCRKGFPALPLALPRQTVQASPLSRQAAQLLDLQGLLFLTLRHRANPILQGPLFLILRHRANPVLQGPLPLAFPAPAFLGFLPLYLVFLPRQCFLRLWASRFPGKAVFHGLPVACGLFSCCFCGKSRGRVSGNQACCQQDCADAGCNVPFLHKFFLPFP